MVEGFFGFEFFDSGIFLAGKFGKIFWGYSKQSEHSSYCARVARPRSSPGWSCLELSFIMLLLKQKMFLGVSSVVRMTTRSRKDKFRWYDEQTNTNIQFQNNVFFCKLIISFNPFWKFLRLRNLAWDFLGVNFCSKDFLRFCWKSLIRDFFGF